MKPAPIQLTEYFLTELHLSANPKFDSKQEVPMEFKDFQVVFEAGSNTDNNRDWQLSLKLQHQPAAEANVPYRFSAEMVGFLLVHPEYPAEKVERLVKTNGASMLFGALREIIRDATARGPYSPVFLPSTSFYESNGKTSPATAAPQSPPAAQSSEPTP